jgi:hypothetical protein
VYNGLSLDQAPPISVVLRFFLTVPVFGIALCALLFFAPREVLTPLHPYSLSAIHLMFLGVMSMSMIGALFQMQSVLGGKPIPAPVGNALIIHTFLTVGTLSLATAFLWSQPILFTLASILLGAAIVYTANLVLPLLFGGVTHDTLRGMRLALIALAFTAVLGIVMASSYASASFGFYHEAVRTSHYSLGLIGWAAALIIAVAFQVIEMFYVTAPYSRWCKRNAFRVLAAALVFKIAFAFTGWPYGWIADIVIAGWLGGFAVTTLKRLSERKRRVSDVSIRFWTVGMALLLIASAAHTASLFIATATLETLALFSYALFVLAVILGMMSKIVPFLVWFHLNSAGFMDAPIMSNVIPASRSKLLFTLFALTALALLAGCVSGEALAAAGFFGSLMFSVLLYNLLKALSLYRHTLAHGQRFTFE